MGKAIDIISGSATAPGATLTALTMASGDSLTIRNYTEGSARLLTAWPTGKTTLGALQIRSPRMHDNVRGIQLPNPTTPTQPALRSPYMQSLVAQDTLSVLISGSAGVGELMLASLLIYYDNLPGINANLIDRAALMSRGQNIITITNTITAATGPNYTGAETINAEVDLMRANTDYALIGYQVTTGCGAVTIRGSDTGNMRVGGPGRTASDMLTSSWYIHLSDLTGLPCIPVINSANKSNTYIEVQQDEAAAAVPVTTIWVELSIA